MQITIDTKTDSHDDLRSAAAFLLHIVGDLGRDDETPAPKIPTAPSAATAPAIASSVAPVAVNVPPPPAIVPPATVSSVQGPLMSSACVVPPPPAVPVGTNSDEGEDETDTSSNVVNFPVPPPPPSANTAAPTPPAPVAPTVAGVSTVVSALNQTTPQGAFGFDSAGMPYDARIHQKTGNKKKNGTWKLIKGIDAAIVAAVTAELAARKGASAPVSLPQPPNFAAGVQSPGPILGAVAPVSLPYAPSDPNRGANTVPVPPPPAVAAPNSVPTPPVTAPVPVPPVAAVGAVGANGPSFRVLIDKITAATKTNQITPQKVAEVCQMHGAPNLMQLNAMPHLIADVSSSIDAVIAGLS